MGGSTWAWVSRRVEAQVLTGAIKHLSKVIEVAKATEELFSRFLRGDSEGFKGLCREVHRLEGEADAIKRELLKELSKGLIHPISREELVRLVLINDDIAVYLKAATRRACLVEPNVVSEGIKELVLSMVRKVREATELLKEAIEELSRDPRKSLELADRVESIEEEVDELRINALAKVLKFCDESRPSACIVAKEVVDAVENSADRCEDSADVIRSVAILRI